MSKHTGSRNIESVDPEEEARAVRLADWAESDDFHLADTATAVRVGDSDADALLTDVFGAEELGRLRGRPSLSGKTSSGPSPKRQVRLPHELDALLRARAEAEHRKPSDLMRDALTEYLSKAS